MREILSLGIDGFQFDDLYDVKRLPGLDAAFLEDLKERDLPLSELLARGRSDPGSLAPKEYSSLLTRTAPHLSRFLGRLFPDSRPETERQRERTAREAGLSRFKRDLPIPRVAQRRMRKSR